LTGDALPDFPHFNVLVGGPDNLAVPLNPPQEHIDPTGSLAGPQVSGAWPEIGPTVLVHDVACGRRERGETPVWEWVEAARVVFFVVDSGTAHPYHWGLYGPERATSLAA
jgi:hypothetical protein